VFVLDPAVKHFAKSLQLRGLAQIIVHTRVEAFSALFFCHVRSKRDYQVCREVASRRLISATA
jgi:hypothetical protein